MTTTSCSKRKSSTRSRWKARIPSTSKSFIPREEVDEIYLDESYYIVPDDKVAHEAFAVVREAMKEKGMVGSRGSFFIAANGS